MLRKVVLAYSGGLDTTVCIPLLREEYDFDEVITVAVDVGQPQGEIRRAEERAEQLGTTHYTVDAKGEFVRDYVYPLIKANGCYEGYVMGTSIARPLIARKSVEIAEREGAEALAHGATGKGNDQLRFDVIFRKTNLDVIAPMREMNLTREWEIEYAREHGIEVPVTRDKPWSVDENIWSRSIEGGKLEEPSYIAPDEIFEWTTAPEEAPDRAEILEVEFESGVPVALGGERMSGVDLIMELNEVGGEHGVGRSDLMEDRVLGLKARENYEHPAATILLKAHRDLEQLVLTRRELRFKQLVDQEWSELAYMGLVDEPLMDDLEAFINQTQERVSGTVWMKLFKGSAKPVARDSPHAMYSEELVSFDTKAIDQRAAEGYSQFYGLQARLYRRFIDK